MLKDSASRTLQSVTGNTAYSLIDQVVVSGTRFATTVMVGRLGSEAELGIYALAFSILVLVINCQESLISIPYTVYVKRLERQRQRQYAAHSLGQSVCLNLIAMALLMVGCSILAIFKTSTDFGLVLAVLAVMLPFMLLREFARRFAFAHLKMKSVLVLDVAVSVLQLIGLGLLAWSGSMTALGAYCVTGIATGIGGIAWLFFSRRNLRWSPNQFHADFLKNWRYGKWVAIAHLVSVFHLYFVHWLLVVVYDQRMTGVFTACLTILVLTNPFILGMSNILSPKAAHEFVDRGAKAVGRLVWKYVRIVAAVLSVFAVLAAIYGNRFIVLVFKEEYAGNDAAIALLAVGTIALGVSYSLGNGLRAIDRPETNFWAGMVGLMITVTISTLLVVPHGIFGATAGLVAGFYAMTIYRIIAFQWFVKELSAANVKEDARLDPAN